MNEISVTALRMGTAAVLERVERGETITITRDGAPVAALLPADAAVWCEALQARFRDRVPPFTQSALDAWIASVMDRADLTELLAPGASVAAVDSPPEVSL
ncbi:MAG: type II toxin-antitoxin system prevent-host-death family antitoxin [Phycisphaerales bacterium]|nr:type II toxin-antitoxin system prevent-host-death family antitoxin [Phycisphaerales bacterium]